MTDTNRTRKRWKDFLLRSGTPLEYEAATVFSSLGFDVWADFGFLRRDTADTYKEWSIDIDAHWEPRKQHSPHFSINVLAECKYRSPDKCFVFFTDPNTNIGLGTLGGTIQSYDQFVPYYLPYNSFVKLERELPKVYKGVELHEGSANDEDLRRAITQLRYATPYHLRRCIEWTLDGVPSDASSFFTMRILITNAPLYILRPGLGIEDIRRAEELTDISDEAQTAILYTDYGPDYENHFRKAFSGGMKDVKKRAKRAEKYLRDLGFEIEFEKDPQGLVSDLIDAHRCECRGVSTQFFIATLEGLPQLLKDIQNACQTSIKKRSLKPRLNPLPPQSEEEG